MRLYLRRDLESGEWKGTNRTCPPSRGGRVAARSLAPKQDSDQCCEIHHASIVFSNCHFLGILVNVQPMFRILHFLFLPQSLHDGRINSAPIVFAIFTIDPSINAPRRPREHAGTRLVKGTFISPPSVLADASWRRARTIASSGGESLSPADSNHQLINS